MKIVAIIPARYASTRLPGKPLLDICGKPMIQHVWEKAKQAKGLDEVIVATDDERIAQAVKQFGGIAVMTSPQCNSGSDRLNEVMKQIPADIYVNIQGDEPLLDPAAIEKLLDLFKKNPDVKIGTICSIMDAEEAALPQHVKVVTDNAGKALYFGRSLLPFIRDAGDDFPYMRHIGLYAYTADMLRIFPDLPPSSLEKAEKLEQLRFLQAGYPIHVAEVEPMEAGVDTPEDLERVRAKLRQKRHADAIDRLKNIRLIITDVDGVLTDGSLYYGSDGESLKCFTARDGLGFKMLEKAGIPVVILSGRDSAALRARIADLGIREAHLGKLDKKSVINEICKNNNISPKEVAIIGDDLPDLEAFGSCGISVTVADAPEYVRDKADMVLQTAGGKGAFRELVDLILSARSKK